MDMYSQHSTGFLEIQSDIHSVQEGLDTILNQYNSRKSTVAKKSQLILNYFHEIKQRSEVLQSYLTSIMQSEKDLRKQMKDFEDKIIIEEDHLKSAVPKYKSRLNSLEQQEKLYTKRFMEINSITQRLNTRIKQCLVELKSISGNIDLYNQCLINGKETIDNDPNVETFLEVQKIREQIQKMDDQAEKIAIKLKGHEKKQEQIFKNHDSIEEIKRMHNNVKTISSKAKNATNQKKILKQQQKTAQEKLFKYSQEMSQILSQKEHFNKSTRVFSHYFAVMPQDISTSDQLFETRRQIQELLKSIEIQHTEQNKTAENQKDLISQLESQNNSINQQLMNEEQKSKEITGKMHFVDNKLNDISFEASNEEVIELKNEYQKLIKENNDALIKEALYKYKLDHIDSLHHIDLYYMKKKYLEEIDEINSQIASTKNGICQALIDIESSYWTLNVFEAENMRIADDTDTLNSFTKSLKFDPSTTYQDHLSKAENHLSNVKELNNTIQNLDDQISMKRESIHNRTSKLIQTKQIYEDSLFKIGSLIPTLSSVLSPSICSGSPVVKTKRHLTHRILSEFLQQIQSEAQYWDEIGDLASYQRRMKHWNKIIDKEHKTLDQYINPIKQNSIE